MSLIFWRKSDPTGDEVDHGSNTVVDEQNALPVGIYWKPEGSDDAEVVNEGHPFPVEVVAQVTGSQGYSVDVSFTRPNDTTAYTANDAVGGTTATGGAVLKFYNMGRPGQMLITSVALEIDVNAVPSGMTSFDLHLYSATPPSALADNAAWDLPVADRNVYLGKIILGTPADVGSTLYIEQNSTPGSNLPKQITMESTSLFAYLVTVGAYTPTASAVKKITLHAVEV